MDAVSTIGFLAATGTTISFLPQAIRCIRTGNTRDLSLPMYIILNLGVILWLLYGVLISDMPIIFANAITMCFTLTILVLKIKHG